MSVPQAPQGPVPAIGIPDSQDYPRLVFSAPYFNQVPLAELIAPAVTEAVEAQLPSLVPPFVDQAAQDAVNQLAVLLAGSTMQGPLYLNPVMPTQPSQAASMAYVDSMIATAGIPEVPPTPIGQVWARETGQWVPISQSGGTYLPIGGGTMQGQINMGGNAITNLPALPVMPNGAAPAQWVLQQIASTSLYQGTWDMDTYTPDLTQLSTHVNAWTWIAITTSASGVVIGPPIPGLQGQTVFNGDTVIFSATAGAFQAIHSGGLTLAEANALYLQLVGGQMSGPLLLNANATQPTQAVTLQQLQTLVAGYVAPDAPTDGQGYLRVGATQGWTPGLPLTGGVTTGPILLSGNATNALAAVPYQQLVSYTAGNFLPLAGGSMTGLIQLSGNATAPLNPVTLTQLTSMLGSYLPLVGGTLTGPLALSGASSNLTVGGTATINGNIIAGANLSVPGQISCAGSVFLPLNVSVNWNLQSGGGYATNAMAAVITLGTNDLGFNVAPAGAVGAMPSYFQPLVLYPEEALFTGNVQINSYSGSGGPLSIVTPSDTAAIMFTTVTGVRSWYIGTFNNGEYAIVDQTAAAARVLIDGNGNFTVVNGALFVGGGNLVLPNTANWMLSPQVATTGQLSFVYNGTAMLWMTTGGAMYASSYQDTSDPRTKTDIAAYIPGVSAISQLDPITFRFNGLGSTPLDPDSVTRVGLDASAVQAVIPEAVSSYQGLLNKTDTAETALLTLDTKPVLMALINAVKQLLNRITVLEAAAAITPPAADTA